MTQSPERIQFVVMGPPIAWARVADKGLTVGKHGNTYMEKFDPNSKAKLNFLAKAALYRPDKLFDCPVEVNIAFYFKRPQDHYGRNGGQLYLKPDAPEFYAAKKRHDIDNCIKFVLDCLNGQFIIDDGQICKIAAEKRYCDKLPYTEVTITQLTNSRKDKLSWHTTQKNLPMK